MAAPAAAAAPDAAARAAADASRHAEGLETTLVQWLGASPWMVRLALALLIGLAGWWPPWLLAGGLDPDNVGDAVRAVRPWGVDVAGGIELAPGVKDGLRMRRFVEAVRAADADAAGATIR